MQAAENPEPKETALTRYVAAEDDSYSWKKISEENLDGATFHELEMTSQTWRGIEWKHRLYVVTPKEMKSDAPLGILIVLGGSLTDSAWRQKPEPGKPRKMKFRKELSTVAGIANKAGIPIAGLLDIPNQPLYGRLYEDYLIAHTFKQYGEDGDETWPLLLPMVKGAVRAMDAVEDFLKAAKKRGLSGWLVTGASKRGWTTWLTPVVDKRVKAIAPIVYDNLDLSSQMKHQLEMWNEFSRKIKPYTKLGLPERAVREDEWSKKLGEIVDPYSYIRQLTIPKLMVIGTNDKYWPLDALNLYYDKLSGEKNILYIPNGDHGLGKLGTITAVKSIIAFAMKTGGQIEWPKLEWEFAETEDSVELTVKSSVKPQVVRAWFAASDNSDFRAAKWEGVKIDAKDGKYVYKIAKPENGCVALLVRARFKVDEDIAYSLCTNVRIFKRGGEEKQNEK
jgi:PhoPQ-activated pathogenicity-related protein